MVDNNKRAFWHFTFKDILSILCSAAIPIALAIYTAIGSQQQKQQDEKKQNFDLEQSKELRQQTLYDEFINNIYRLEKDGYLKERKNPWAFANAYYRAAHLQWDTTRKAYVLQFLKEKQLIGRNNCTNGCRTTNLDDIIRLNKLNFDNAHLVSQTGVLNQLDLECVSFDQVSMSNAIFSFVSLNGVSSDGGRLDKVKFDGSSLLCARFNNVNLSGADFGNSDLTGAQFLNSDLSNAILTEDQIKQAYFYNVTMPNGEKSETITSTTTKKPIIKATTPTTMIKTKMSTTTSLSTTSPIVTPLSLTTTTSSSSSKSSTSTTSSTITLSSSLSFLSTSTFTTSSTTTPSSSSSTTTPSSSSSTTTTLSSSSTPATTTSSTQEISSTTITTLSTTSSSTEATSLTAAAVSLSTEGILSTAATSFLSAEATLSSTEATLPLTEETSWTATSIACNSMFLSRTIYSVGVNPVSIAVVDVNSDNKPDIVTANTNSSDISVLLNTGNGTFSRQVKYSVGTYPSAVAVADVNSDNKPDIVTTNIIQTSIIETRSTVSVLLNRGNGTFSRQTKYSVAGYTSAIVVTDVNSDSKPDIVIASGESTSWLFLNRINIVAILLNKGNGTFSSQTNYSVGLQPVSVAVADVNDDNKLDIITANSGSGTISVLLNTDNGTFSLQTTYAVGAAPQSVAVADVNSDNKSDIIAANLSGNTVSVLLQC